MVAIITGDIINSADHTTAKWMGPLKQFLFKLGPTPKVWEIYRGDEFQLRVYPDEALKIAIQIKALIRSFKGLDVRLAIGLGEESFQGNGVSESNGTAYQRSGRTLEIEKQKKVNMMISSDNPERDKTLNLLLKLALDFMDDWSSVSAEIVTLALEQPRASQLEIAEQLNIQQSAVSQRQKRARLDLIHELLNYYQEHIETSSS